MIEVTFARKWNSRKSPYFGAPLNRKAKGQFKLKFNSVEELVVFMRKQRSLMVINFNNMSKDELKVYSNKYLAYGRKTYMREHGVTDINMLF